MAQFCHKIAQNDVHTGMEQVLEIVTNPKYSSLKKCYSFSFNSLFLPEASILLPFLNFNRHILSKPLKKFVFEKYVFFPFWSYFQTGSRCSSLCIFFAHQTNLEVIYYSKDIFSTYHWKARSRSHDVLQSKVTLKLKRAEKQVIQNNLNLFLKRYFMSMSII